MASWKQTTAETQFHRHSRHIDSTLHEMYDLIALCLRALLKPFHYIYMYCQCKRPNLLFATESQKHKQCTLCKVQTTPRARLVPVILIC